MTVKGEGAGPSAAPSRDLASYPSCSIVVDGGRESEHRIVRAPVSLGPLLQQIASHRAWKQQRKPKSAFKSWTETLNLHDYFVARLRDATVQTGLCHVRLAEGPFVTESISPMGPEQAAQMVEPDPPADAPRGGEGFLIGGALDANYFHWLTQVLPTLDFFPSDGARAPCKLVMGEPKAWQMRTLELAGFTRRDIEVLGQAEARTYDGLLYAYSDIGQFHGFRRNMRPFFDRMRQRAKVSGREDLRLYISRRDTHRRPLRNEAELEAALVDRGFTVIRAGDLTVDEQIDAFSRARIVVGPHGAGFANVVFCRSGTPVYELLPSHSVAAHNFRLTQYFDLPYWGDCFEVDDVEAVILQHAGWSVDLPYVLGRVDECLQFHSVPDVVASSPPLQAP